MKRAGILLALVLASGCKGNDAPQSDGTTEQQPQPLAMPTTDAAFLAELAPLPDGAEAIEVRYRISGSGLGGEMVVIVGAGGKRHEHWQLHAGVGETELRTAGSRIVDADHMWTAIDGKPGQLRVNHLGALARAWLALDEAARAKVVESIRTWHRMLAEQRAADPGTRGEVLGVPCLQTRIAAQNVCMWEEAGLLLRYEGSAFTIEATQIDRAPKLDAQTFALPAEAKTATADAGTPPNFEQVLAEIADGSYGSVSALVLANEALPALHVPE